MKSELLSFEKWSLPNKNKDRVLELLKTDRTSAIILLKVDREKFVQTTILWATRSDGFTIRIAEDMMKVSSNNKIYYLPLIPRYIIFKNGKFWSKIKKNIYPLTYNSILEFVRHNDEFKEVNERIYNIFSPIRFIKDHVNNFPLLANVSFNTIIKHKLYSLKKLVSYVYKCDFPEAINKSLVFKKINLNLKDITCYNYHKLNKDLLEQRNTFMLVDAVRYASILGKKVNLAWSIKRLTLEHDIWSQQVNNLTGEFFNEALQNHKAFTELEKQEPRLKLYKTSRELVELGRREKHCVAGYSIHVNSGSCAIFDFKGYTAQIVRSPTYKIAQIQGVQNSAPPIEVVSELAGILLQYTPPSNVSEPVFQDDLPF